VCNFPGINAAEAAVAAATANSVPLKAQAKAKPLRASWSSKRPTSSGYFGVYQSNKSTRWCAQISRNSKVFSIGTFDTKEEAAAAYDEGALNIYGSACNTTDHYGTHTGPSLNFGSIEEAREVREQAAAERAMLSVGEVAEQPKKPKSGYYGVYSHSKSFMASLRCNGSSYSASASEILEAAAVYDALARQFRGALAVCNFPDTHGAVDDRPVRIRVGGRRRDSGTSRTALLSSVCPDIPIKQLKNENEES
jgi:hypothetical protein